MSSGLKVPSPPTPSSRSSSHSARSIHPTPARSIVTSPPWAQDEPASPTDDPDVHATPQRPSYSRPSDAASFQSSVPPGSVTHGSHWWTFVRPRSRAQGQADYILPGGEGRVGGEGSSYNHGAMMKSAILRLDRSKSWMPTSSHYRSPNLSNLSPPPAKGFKDHRSMLHASRNNQNTWDHTIELPTATLAQSRTPGWDTPWTARTSRHEPPQAQDLFGSDDDHHQKSSKKNTLRMFILTNTYVPLLFRFINITFTTAALGVAIRIRLIEIHNQIEGALGSSTTIVIIFSPFTLVHVMVAIYLEYFGRPLGLWNTSSKLTHTLMEVLFVCAWSAALSLSFDNYFTSLIPCAGPSSISWYYKLARPTSPMTDLGRHGGGVADRLCDDQVRLIILVGVGLIMYCINLVISLFRIFEKVKYRVGT